MKISVLFKAELKKRIEALYATLKKSGFFIRFFLVATPEHYTSKTCSKCFHPCGPFRELEAIRRQEKEAQAKTPEEKKKASRITIRSIRRCQNEKCGVILHRDRNAASNIATNFKLLYKGEAPLKGMTAIEDALDMLRCSVCA